MVEVHGLSATINTADVMVKAASVELIKTERARGSGWMTIFISGDVGAVNAAVDAGVASAKNEGKFISSKVIPRPSEGVENQIMKNTKNATSKDEVKQEDTSSKVEEKKSDNDDKNDTEEITDNQDKSEKSEATESSDVTEEESTEKADTKKATTQKKSTTKKPVKSANAKQKSQIKEKTKQK